jgi:MerR family Zn(II)-responsive transcriptional regulator of zntA
MEKQPKGTYKIGQLAKQAGVTIHTLRFYDRIGILKPKIRLDSGYRVYDEGDLNNLLFIQKAKMVGLTLDEISFLFRLNPREENCTQMAKILRAHISELEENLRQFRHLRKILLAIEEECKNSPDPNLCPILEKLRIPGPQEHNEGRNKVPASKGWLKTLSLYRNHPRQDS